MPAKRTATAPQPEPEMITVGGYTFTLTDLFPEAGRDAARDRERDADERLAALEAQHIAMRTGKRPLR